MLVQPAQCLPLRSSSPPPQCPEPTGSPQSRGLPPPVTRFDACGRALFVAPGRDRLARELELAAAGVTPPAEELPDHLAVLLEFAATVDESAFFNVEGRKFRDGNLVSQSPSPFLEYMS